MNRFYFQVCDEDIRLFKIESGTLFSSDEVHQWHKDNGIELKMGYDRQSKNPHNPKWVYFFEFESEEILILFKLAWGGSR